MECCLYDHAYVVIAEEKVVSVLDITFLQSMIVLIVLSSLHTNARPQENK